MMVALTGDHIREAVAAFVVWGQHNCGSPIEAVAVVTAAATNHAEVLDALAIMRRELSDAALSVSRRTPMPTDLHCWFNFRDGHTCMLADEHDGPHEPTADSEILIGLVEPITEDTNAD